jgi:putative ABC transport system ATP-binding protein
MTTASPIVALRMASKTYGRGNARVEALKSATVSIQPGEFAAIVGASGSGKSTMLNLLGCLDVPCSGSCLLAGVETASLAVDQRSRLRRDTIGFVFQGYQLLERMDAWRNVELPLIYRGVPPPERGRRVERALDAVGLIDRARHRPGAMSGGQQQRIAIARAIVSEPPLLIADEPTGAVDAATGDDIIDVFHTLNRTQNTTVVLVTHDERIAHRCGRMIRLVDGRIVSDTPTDARRDAG